MNQIYHITYYIHIYIRGNLFKLSNVGVGSKACRGLLPLVGRPRLCIFTAGEIVSRNVGMGNVVGNMGRECGYIGK